MTEGIVREEERKINTQQRYWGRKGEMEGDVPGRAGRVGKRKTELLRIMLRRKIKSVLWRQQMPNHWVHTSSFTQELLETWYKNVMFRAGPNIQLECFKPYLRRIQGTQHSYSVHPIPIYMRAVLLSTYSWTTVSLHIETVKTAKTGPQFQSSYSLKWITILHRQY